MQLFSFLLILPASEHALMSGHFPSFPAGLPFPQQMPGASVGLPFPQQVPSSRGSSQWGKTIGERIDPKVPLEQQRLVFSSADVFAFVVLWARVLLISQMFLVDVGGGLKINGAMLHYLIEVIFSQLFTYF